jgi:hypothetical protein
VNALRATIIATLNDRFIELKSVDAKGTLHPMKPDGDCNWQPTELPPPEQLDGYLKPDRILIYPHAWSRLTNNAAETAGYLFNKDWLIAKTPGKPNVERIGQGQPSQRFYVLRREFLKGEEEEDT